MEKRNYENYYKKYVSEHHQQYLSYRRKTRLKKTLSKPQKKYCYKYTVTRHGETIGEYLSLRELSECLGLSLGYTGVIAKGKMEFYYYGLKVCKEIR